jgi:large subunit ribosomal protein L9
MKIILLKDIKGVGRSGDLITVADGYAANLLFPKKLGVQATPAELAKYKANKEKEARDTERLKELAKKLSQEPLQLTLKTGPHGEVFNSITKDDIASALKKRGCVAVTIGLEKPIRVIGEHAVTAHLGKGIEAKITIVAAVDK